MAESLPTPEELGATLDAALSAQSQLPTNGGGELTEPGFLDDLEITESIGSDEGLQYLLKLVEQNPGLKITLSYG